MKRILLYYFLLVVLTMFGFVRCAEDKAIEPVISASCTNNGTDIISFHTDIVPILTTYCTDTSFGDCHQTGSTNGDYTTYDGVDFEVNTGALEERVLQLKDMPSPSSLGPTILSNCELEKIQVWLNQGALDN